MRSFMLSVAGLALVASSVVAQGSSTPPTWGGTKQWTCNVTMLDAAKDHPVWNFTYYYDATIPADRYEHKEGQKDEVCKVASVPPLSPCTVINTPDGTAWVLSQSSCCKFPLPIGPVIYDWVERSHGSFSYQKEINGVVSDVWIAMGNSKNYFAEETAPPHRPVRYWEYKRNLLKKWDFNLDTFTAGQPPRELFVPPADCDQECVRV